MRRLVIAATNSGIGKTTISCGIARALSDMNYDVSCFKVGADYIDIGYHRLSTGNTSSNLDEFMLSKDEIKKIFSKNARDISIVEGVMGLFDGYQDRDDYCSTSSMAKILDANIILIVDAGKMATSIAALVKGFLDFDKDLKIRGLILNNVNTDSHYNILKSAIKKVSDIKVLGHIPKIKDIGFSSRHLGLNLVDEDVENEEKIRKIADVIKQNIDLKSLVELSENKDILCESDEKNKRYDVVLALAKDKAFNFYYEDGIEHLKSKGVKIVEFDTFKDEKLPYCHAVYIGGGYPELYAKDISKNKSLMRDIYEKSNQNMPIYAECGGLMYLGQKIVLNDKEYDMVGIFEGVSTMSEKLQRFGYCNAISKIDTPISKQGQELRGHEFHYSTFQSEVDTVFDMRKTLFDKSVKKWGGGYLKNKTLATYLHTHFANDDMAENFCQSMEKYKKILELK
ncbi:cobyrinic acid a,c-diamide synthase [Peptostreptococcaceae bacterium AS15]|nr:cobyrinic acid a,c-diamide synthase [Peptostreptococcaceae bacterium AS15]